VSRLLLIGASGQLGQALRAAFGERHDVVEAAYQHPGAGQLVVDLGDRASTMAALNDVKPAVVLIAGARTHVDGCEVAPEECLRINVDGPATVAGFARGTGAWVVYYSTDYVFDGGEPSYGEDDPVTPLNVYGRSKAEGESAVRSLVPDHHLVMRTSWVYGPDAKRRNFALRLVDALSRPGPPVRIPSDQWGSPTYTQDLAAATGALLDEGRSGTFHATGPEPIDRASLARRICAVFSLDVSRVVPTPTDEMGQGARRPMQVRLRGDKLAATGLASFRGVDAGLQALRATEPR
jgi:dTDP-4-dehydrorhamnose reductase